MTEVRDLSVLVIGAGSIGRRHLRNLSQLGVGRLAVTDVNAASLAAGAAETRALPFADLGRALAETHAEAVFVCTPPIFHVAQALQALRAGAHVFIEKPLSDTLDGVDELTAEAERRGRVIQVGYNLRFHPALQLVKRLLDEGAIGRVLWAQAEVGQHLPDWRPGQDYRAGYTARAELGGGIILDASHEIDYLLWLLGEPREVRCLAGRVSDLEVDVEDCATLLLSFAGRTQACIHMDFVQRSYVRRCKLAGETGTISWDYAQTEVRRYDPEARSWRSYPFEFAANDMYLAEAAAFLKSAAGGPKPLVGLTEARAALRVALAAKQAATLRGVALD